MPAAGKALRFTHIHVKNWRNFAKAGVSLERRAFLVGPNASGKSNFLDVFRFLHDLVCIGGGFQEALRQRGGVPRLRCLAARQQSDLVIHARVGNVENIWTWEYELHFNQEERQRPTIRRERVTCDGRDLVDRPDEADRGDPERLTQTYLEQVNVNREFRAVADFFRSIRYLHVVPVWFGWDGESIYISAFRSTRKVKELIRNKDRLIIKYFFRVYRNNIW